MRNVKIYACIVSVAFGVILLMCFAYLISKDVNTDDGALLLAGLILTLTGSIWGHEITKNPWRLDDLEDFKIYETLGQSVGRTVDGMHIIILRQNGELMLCVLKEIPPPCFEKMPCDESPYRPQPASCLHQGF